MNRIIYYSYIQLCDMCAEQFERKSNISAPILLPYLFLFQFISILTRKAALASPQWRNDHICLGTHLLRYIICSLPKPSPCFPPGEAVTRCTTCKAKPCWSSLFSVGAICLRFLGSSCAGATVVPHLEHFFLPLWLLWLFGNLEHTRN